MEALPTSESLLISLNQSSSYAHISDITFRHIQLLRVPEAQRERKFSPKDERGRVLKDFRQVCVFFKARLSSSMEEDEF